MQLDAPFHNHQSQSSAGARTNVRGYPYVVGVGLTHDADEELARGQWKLRPLAPFAWHTHVDERLEGYRWLRRASELPEDPAAAAGEIGDRVVGTLRRSLIL